MSGCLCIRWPGVTANYVPACADSRSGLMSGCSCIRWPGAYSFLRIMFRRVQTAAVGLCRGVYVFVGRVFRRGLTATVVQKKPPYRLQRIVRYDGSVIIIIIIWQRLPQPQALRPLEVLLLPRMSVLGKVL